MLKIVIPSYWKNNYQETRHFQISFHSSPVLFFHYLKNKKILLGVTGSIAAYKAALLVRILVKDGAEVRVIMTESAKDFITPLTLSTLSKNPVLSKFIKNETGDWNNFCISSAIRIRQNRRPGLLVAINGWRG